ncbi:phosphoadenylyl-sulfate reductase [Corynebacterium sp. 320]|uniref:phosphoadenylyl-sulfate reductase n=1 Tax=Corynebacterium TaxID=1716 RepID=UPI00125CCAAE|nr:MULTISPECIES: phosphoadenylyl-sulfate reductase [Corynebacterium]KAB1503092.1 phosphoadenylyl-sulfate reductase [Corynebacterium sp. 320]KAB1550697.1 phosphoadenylyl-sulfate reductase [Corynebacterium sp. 321]KAB1551056.1 phosphoadenylyl-sulfate reductase [Corynebacterium sp. 319]KAB3526889.1 phosphoadenylyl-sulfate reductase [Corynebacterium sp. 250]KAB3538382.1 phosphoadenylyl-sulfate reductase [Corynebacterium sp. 366]
MSFLAPVGLLGGNADDYRDPNISPEGEPTTTTPLSDEQRAAHEELVAQWNDQLEGATAEEVIEWAEQHVTGRIAVTMSMQDTILAELTEGRLHNAELVFLDTGYHFEETIQTRDEVVERYTLPLTNVTPTLTKDEQDSIYGKDLYRRNNTACCRMRKVEPLARMLNPFEAWVTGVRRVDNELRANTPVLEVDRTGRLKINPIVAWSDEEVENFIDDHDLIINPLTKQGYPSIGCATCTLPVAPGEDPRSGRWAGTNKTECGLHT